MKQFEYTIKDPHGIQSRPAGLLAREAANYASVCTLTKNGRTSQLNQLLLLLTLGVRCGDQVTVCTEGPDEEAAIARFRTLFEAYL